MLKLILPVLFFLPCLLLSQIAPYTLILEGGYGNNSFTNNFETAISLRLVYDHGTEKRTNFFNSAGLFAHFTETQFKYVTGKEQCLRDDTFRERCYPDDLYGFTPISEKRISLGTGLRHTYRKFSVRMAINPSFRVRVRKTLRAAKSSEFARANFDTNNRTYLEDEVSILQRSYLIRPNSNFQLQLSTDVHSQLGQHLSLGFGLRWDALPYTLSLENPGRDIPDAPLILAQADMRTFAIMASVAWRL